MREFAPTPGLTNALKGTFSEPIATTNPKREYVTVRLSKEGSGQWDIPYVEENKNRAGINNHSLLTGRYSLHLADKLLIARDRGIIDFDNKVAPNPQIIGDAEIVSHPGRWAWENARDYPHDVNRLLGQEEGNRRRSMTNEALGLEFIQGKVSESVFEIVAALAHNSDTFPIDPDTYESFNYRITSYVDHRTTDRWQPLDTRMAGFLTNYFFERHAVNPEITTQMKETVKELIQRQKNSRLENSQPVSLNEADDVIGNIGASEASERLSRKDVVSLILQDATTEADLVKAGVDPDSINDTTVKMPKWESQLRREYVAAATDEIVERIDRSVQKEIDMTFPPDTWWGENAREIYIQKTT